MPIFNNSNNLSSSWLETNVGIFGELEVGNPKDDINLKFIYPYYNTNYELKPTILTGNATNSISNGYLELSSATNGTALVKSLEKIRYRSGHTGYAEFTSSFVGRRKGCVDTTISQVSFNGNINVVCKATINWIEMF